MNHRNWIIPATLTAAFIMALAIPAQAESHEGPNLGRVSLSMSSDFVTGYYFRGIAQEPHGVIWQPAVEVGFNVYEGDGAVSSLSVVGGIWSSLHDEGTGAVAGPSRWYEADLYAGISMTVLDNIGATILYTAYTSPNGAFSTVEEVSLALAYDDAGFWAERDIISLPGFEGFQPYVLFAFEIQDQADAGNGMATLMTEEGVYFEFGIEPSMTVFESENHPITMSVPVVVGMSLDDYYEFFDSNGARQSDAFGYVSAGLLFSMPITAIPSEYGAWEAYAGVDFLFIGDSAAQANNTGRHDIGFEVIGTFGVSMNY